MKYYYVLILFALAAPFTQGQQDSSKNSYKSSLFELSITQGVQRNFFVDYDLDVNIEDGYIQPVIDFGDFDLYQKRSIGYYSAYRGSIRLGGRNYLELAYEKATNIGTYNGSITTASGTSVSVQDFELRHINNFYTVRFKRALGVTNRMFITAGLSHISVEQSEITINPSTNFVQIQERNNSNSGLSELGASLGFQYYFYQSGNFQLGVESQIYSIISYGPELETFSLSPILKFSF